MFDKKIVVQWRSFVKAPIKIGAADPVRLQHEAYTNSTEKPSAKALAGSTLLDLSHLTFNTMASSLKIGWALQKERTTQASP